MNVSETKTDQPEQSDRGTRDRALGLLRELALTWQTIENQAAARCRELGVTGSEFDVLFTLGAAGRLTFREIGERTLTAKTTLTGIIDRLENKGLVQRRGCPDDRRCTFVELSADGQALYDRHYPEHVAWVNDHFSRFSPAELAACQDFLRRLRESF